MTDGRTTQAPTVRRSRQDVETRITAAISRRLDWEFDLTDVGLEELSRRLAGDVVRALVSAGVDL